MKGAGLLVLLSVALAGCAAPPAAPTVYDAQGSSPVVFRGYDYAGATHEMGPGNITVHLDAASDTGTVIATFPHEGKAWRVEFTRFQESRPFQEGGVRLDFPEHGDSGNGDALLPRIHANAAGWGVGQVTVDGQPFPDPTTGNATFNLHVMVTDTAPRDPTSHQVTKADGATLYDPAAPADAKTQQGVRQILLNVQSAGPAGLDQVVNFTGDVAGPMYDQIVAQANVTSAQSRIHVQANVTPALPIGAGPVAFDVILLDPADQPVGRCHADPAPATGPTACSIDAPSPAVVGTYKVRFAGAGAEHFEGALIVAPPPPVFLHVVYAQA